MQQISGYNIMWIFVLYDLPTHTKKQVRAATRFRKRLLDAGFQMGQYSVYLRVRPSREHTEALKESIRRAIPKWGVVSILEVTDKQYANMEVFFGDTAYDPADLIAESAVPDDSESFTEADEPPPIDEAETGKPQNRRRFAPTSPGQVPPVPDLFDEPASRSKPTSPESPATSLDTNLADNQDSSATSAKQPRRRRGGQPPPESVQLLLF